MVTTGFYWVSVFVLSARRLSTSRRQNSLQTGSHFVNRSSLSSIIDVKCKPICSFCLGFHQTSEPLQLHLVQKKLYFRTFYPSCSLVFRLGYLPLFSSLLLSEIFGPLVVTGPHASQFLRLELVQAIASSFAGVHLS